MSQAIIKTENLCFSYDDDGEKKPVLFDINLEIEKGSFVAVLGHNGSGKSTLAKLLNLILSPTSGNLYLFGEKIEKDISDDDIYKLRRRIGMVFQNPDNQLVATIVEEDVAFGPENLGVPENELRKRVDDALKLVGMEAYARHSAAMLSGGQKQRVAIAGIIALLPDVIIFDESTAMLDPSGRAEVLSTVKRLNENGTTVILITHYMEEAAQAGRVIVMDDGRIILDGTPRSIFEKTEILKKAGLGAPQVTELMHELKKRGLDIKTDALTPEEAAAEIKRALGGKK